jgi:hypothetical protein
MARPRPRRPALRRSGRSATREDWPSMCSRWPGSELAGLKRNAAYLMRPEGYVPWWTRGRAPRRRIWTSGASSRRLLRPKALQRSLKTKMNCTVQENPHPTLSHGVKGERVQNTSSRLSAPSPFMCKGEGRVRVSESRSAKIFSSQLGVHHSSFESGESGRKGRKAPYRAIAKSSTNGATIPSSAQRWSEKPPQTAPVR